MSGFGNLMPLVPESDQPEGRNKSARNFHEAAMRAEISMGMLPEDDKVLWWQSLNQLADLKTAR